MYAILDGERIKTASNWKVKQEYQYIDFNYSDFVKSPDNYYIYRQGNVVKNPDFENIKQEKDNQRILNLSMTKRELFLALYEGLGLTPFDIRERIVDEKALIEFDYAAEYYRGNPLIDVVGKMLGLSKEDLDYLFEHKELQKWANQ